MAKPNFITLGALQIAILYEDRAVLAIDKPAGWLLAPDQWTRTGRNLQRALAASIRAGEFWARSRQVKFLRFVHRLDAETTGVLLLAKSSGALPVYSRLFESRQVEKIYWAIVQGLPREPEWVCASPVGLYPKVPGRMRLDPRGKEAETAFRVLAAKDRTALVEARPLTGRTHQVRLHLQAAGHPVLGDKLYGSNTAKSRELALRSVGLNYVDPFQKKPVRIQAPVEAFAARHGFREAGRRMG